MKGKSKQITETGFWQLDEIIGGLQSGQLINIAGDPGIGTSTFALSILQNIAIDANQPVAYFSLDLDQSTITNRIISSQCRVEFKSIIQDILSREQKGEVKITSQILKRVPLYLDSSNYSLASLSVACKRLHENEGIKVFMIDNLNHLSLFRPEESIKQKSMSRAEEEKQIVLDLKKLAKTLNIAIIILSHLDWDKDKELAVDPETEPALHHTGIMAAHADVIIILYRPDYYGIVRGLINKVSLTYVKAIVAKNGNGKADEAIFTLEQAYYQFREPFVKPSERNEQFAYLR